MLAITPFTVLDADGNALCHTPAQTRRTLSSARRNQIRAAVWSMLESAGDYSPETGEVRDVFSPAQVRLSRATHHANPYAVDLCHDVPEVNPNGADGAYCGCNLLPGMHAVNQSTSNYAVQTERTPVVGTDPRTAWRATWLATLATGTKARRAV